MCAVFGTHKIAKLISTNDILVWVRYKSLFVFLRSNSFSHRIQVKTDIVVFRGTWYCAAHNFFVVVCYIMKIFNSISALDFFLRDFTNSAWPVTWIPREVSFASRHFPCSHITEYGNIMWLFRNFQTPAKVFSRQVRINFHIFPQIVFAQSYPLDM